VGGGRGDKDEENSGREKNMDNQRCGECETSENFGKQPGSVAGTPTQKLINGDHVAGEKNPEPQ